MEDPKNPNKAPDNDPHKASFPDAHWHGTNLGYASAIALSNNGAGGPTVVGEQPPNSQVWKKGVFSWRLNNRAGLADTPAAGTLKECDPTVPSFSLVCRPAVLSHPPDSYSASQHFPFFQEFLGLDDASFQKMLDQADTTRKDLDNGKPPLGFTYIEGDYTFNNNTARPGTNDFGMMYVTGSLTINGNQTYKGLIFIDGSLKITGRPVVLGAIMVRGATEVTAGLGNLTLLFSREAVRLGIQAGHPWRILSWTDTEMQ